MVANIYYASASSGSVRWCQSGGDKLREVPVCLACYKIFLNDYTYNFSQDPTSSF